jgi:folylpolyglutamate synthase/dihydropteroate synthase
MTAQLIQAEKFYQKLQKKFSRRINLDRSRIFSALKKFNVSPDKDISADIINVVGSDGKNCVCKLLSSILIQNKKNVTTFTSPSIVSPLDRIFIKNKFITLKKFKNIANRIITSNCKLTLFEVITLIYVLATNKLRGIDYHIVEAGAGKFQRFVESLSNPAPASTM